MITHNPRRSHPRGNTPVPWRWQATGGVCDELRLSASGIASHDVGRIPNP
jgi:hypothetical protein